MFTIFVNLSRILTQAASNKAQSRILVSRFSWSACVTRLHGDGDVEQVEDCLLTRSKYRDERETIALEMKDKRGSQYPGEV